MVKADAGRQFTHFSSPAKVNLFLEILGKRDDGFHELETVIGRLTLADSLWVRPREDDRICLVYQTGSPYAPQLPPPDQNLIHKALLALRESAGFSTGLDVLLEKKIPLQAGLGGGSSNAAAALTAANQALGLGLTLDALSEVAAGIGSDVPYFLRQRLALCRGRGERIEEFPAWGALPLILVMPPFGLSTREVFSQLSCRHNPISIKRRLAAFASGNPRQIASGMFNRLEVPAFEMEPALRAIERAILDVGALGARMSGSGSCMFGVFHNRRTAVRSGKILRSRMRGCRVFVCELRL